MITAVDTNVLMDVFTGDAKFGAGSAEALSMTILQGQIVVCDAVWAEAAAYFQTQDEFEAAMAGLSVQFVPMTRDASSLAGQTWRLYRLQGGKRARMMTDFLIAAHAQVQCDQLLTRDRGFYREYFKSLRIVDPSE